MISRLIPFLGTGLLAAVAGFSAKEAFGVADTPTMGLPKATQVQTTSETTHSHSPTRGNDPDGKIVAVIAERPLFAPTRRPKSSREDTANSRKPTVAQNTSSSKQAEPSNPEPPALSLHGVMQSDDGTSALISSLERAAEWIPEGDEVEGWKLAEIGRDWVIVTNASRQHKVEMY